jgi:hypothetical protein
VSIIRVQCGISMVYDMHMRYAVNLEVGHEHLDGQLLLENKWINRYNVMN